MRLSTKRILSIGAAVILLFGALLVYTVLIRFEVGVINEKRALVQSKVNLYDNQQRAVNQVRKLINQFQNVARLEETIGFAMPEGAQTVKALRQIVSVASLSGATLTALSFKASLPRGAAQPFIKKLGTLEISLGTSGSYEALKRFVRYLETSVRLANAVTIGYQPANLEGASDTLRLKVDMYYQE